MTSRDPRQSMRSAPDQAPIRSGLVRQWSPNRSGSANKLCYVFDGNVARQLRAKLDAGRAVVSDHDRPSLNHGERHPQSAAHREVRLENDTHELVEKPDPEITEWTDHRVDDARCDLTRLDLHARASPRIDGVLPARATLSWLKVQSAHYDRLGVVGNDFRTA